MIDAPAGLHRAGPPADPDALAESGLEGEAAALWRRWDGIDLGNGEATLLSLAEQREQTRAAAEEGILRPGDRVIGAIGRTALVVPADPWEEGGEVVMVEEDGQRAPYASSVLKLGLGLIAEMALLYDDEGEYRDGLFDERGLPTARAERKLVRRRLDFDPDAPFPRFRLGQLLRRGGEPRAATQELERVLRCAPQFEWAHWELGRARLALAESADSKDRVKLRERAVADFRAAAEHVGGDANSLRALFLAWAARASDEDTRGALASEVLALDPGFVAAREAGLREAIEDDDGERARELLALGLAIEPRHLGLLALRGAVEATTA